MPVLRRVPSKGRLEDDPLARGDLGSVEGRARLQYAERVSQSRHSHAAEVVAHASLVVERDPGKKATEALVAHGVVVGVRVVERLMLLHPSRL